MHGRNCEVLFLHQFCEFDDSLLGVAIDQGLVDVQVSVEVEEDIDFPLFLFNGDVVLLDTFESEIFVLDQNLCGISQEVLSELQNVDGHCG